MMKNICFIVSNLYLLEVVYVAQHKMCLYLYLKDLLKNNRDLSKALATSEELIKYTASTLSLSWKMILQQPRMTFDSTILLDENFDDNKAILYFYSANPSTSKAKIEYYVHPGLFLGPTMVRKASVVVRAE